MCLYVSSVAQNVNVMSRSRGGFAVLCRTKPRLLSPSKQRPHGRTSPHRRGFNSTEDESAQFLHFHCSAHFVFFFCLHRRSDLSRAKPNIHDLYPVSERVCVCISLHVYAWVCMNCLCIVCAGSRCRFTMMGVNFLPSCFKHSQLWTRMED